MKKKSQASYRYFQKETLLLHTYKDEENLFCISDICAYRYILCHSDIYTWLYLVIYPQHTG